MTSSDSDDCTQDDLEEQFRCGCCFQLMVQPTTLTCGHSFCRLCLAKWYLESGKQECLVCRQKWRGNPQVNIALRDASEKLFEDVKGQRQQQERDHNAVQTLRVFNQRLTALDRQNSRTLQQSVQRVHVDRRWKQYFFGAGVAVIVVMVMWSLSYWLRKDTSSLTQRPVQDWTRDQVSDWVGELGGWATQYMDRFQEANIDGTLLVALSEDELDILNITESLHRRAILFALDSLRLYGTKPPATLWEYKTLFPLKTLALVILLRSNTRLAILWLYLFQYTNMFLPFIHSTCPSGDLDLTEISLYTHRFSGPSALQWSDFIPKWLFLPFFLMAKFIWSNFTKRHYVVAPLLLLECLWRTVMEANFLRLWISRGSKAEEVQRYIRSNVKVLWQWTYTLLGLSLIWPVLPNFLFNMYFYYLFCLHPVVLLTQVIGLGWKLINTFLPTAPRIDNVINQGLNIINRNVNLHGVQIAVNQNLQRQ